MRVALNLATVNVIERGNKAHTIRLRSADPILVDDAALTPAEDGTTDLNLTPEQSSIIRAWMDPKGEGVPADVAASGVLTLPDGGQRGKPKATGPVLGSFVKA